MIDYGKPPSNQMKIDISDKGADLVREGKRWISDNPIPWAGYLKTAVYESSHGLVSPNYMVQYIRNKYRVSIKNGLAPVLARLAMEEDDRIHFRLAKSMADGFCEVKL